jgi:cytochrome c oxidase assembly protein subunit 15
MADNTLTISKGHRYLLVTATVMTYLLLTMGGTVCITNSGQGCPDWPGCYGQVIPPWRLDALIEYTHRFIAMLTTPLIIAAAVVSWRKARSIRWLSWSPLVALLLALAVVVFGAFAVLTGLPPAVAAIDLGTALLVLAFMVVATVVALLRHRNPTLPDRLSFRSPFARLVLLTLVMVFIVLVSGVLVAESGSMVRCLAWPLFSTMGVGPLNWPVLLRYLGTTIASVLIVGVAIQAWRTQRDQPAILRTATALGGVFLAEIIIGLLLPAANFTIFLLVAYVALAVLLWGLLVALAVLAGLTSFE